MNKILAVVGPTAIGKTELALKLAQRWNGELVSADSRQVYKELNIGTGKDIPRGVYPKIENGYPVYTFDEIPVWGYDLVSPHEEMSVAQYAKAARAIITNIWGRGKLPILVGGTGFYVQALVDGVETLDIPQNKPLRAMLGNMPVQEVFEILAQLDATKAASLNASDRKNKVRLIRAIEVADARIRGKKGSSLEKLPATVLFIGLTATKNTLHERVAIRVQKRVDSGLMNEITQLLDSGIAWDNQSMTSMGYSQWKPYFEGTMTQEEVIKAWVRDEQKYVKRQMTWFKKDSRILWFDVEQEGWQENIEDTVQKWYSTET